MGKSLTNNNFVENNNLMKRLLFPLFTLLMACGRDVTPYANLGQEPNIYPDYKDITIPCNIAPMNFNILDAGDFALLISDEESNVIVHAHKGLFDIPAKRWRTMLNNNAGRELEFTVLRRNGDHWLAYDPFTMRVAPEPIDPYLAYRLIFPAEQWHKMGIYQRDMESFDQSPIYENQMTDYNCINCHTFPAQNPDKMIFHMRAKQANGTALIVDGKVNKIETKSDGMLSHLVYSSWHPGGRYIAASTNSTHKSYYYNNHSRGEVYDTASDVVVWDTERGVILHNDVLASAERLESFPTFSSDGQRLLYCAADSVDQVTHNIEELRYSLLSVDFEATTGRIGNRVDTLYNARTEGHSVSMPRFSPDGEHLVVNIMEYGNFSIYRNDSDLYTIDPKTGELRAIETINSTEAEGSHSWSSNSRWMVFSSRREDRLFTQPYFTYVDSEGLFHKPFLLPQRNPRKYYRDNFNAFNLPEFISGKVEVKPRAIATTMRGKALRLQSER